MLVVGGHVNEGPDVLGPRCAAKPHPVGDPLAAVLEAGPGRRQCRGGQLEVRVLRRLW